MPDQKISADPQLASPTQQARLAGIDHGTSTTTNYQFSPAATKLWLQTGASDLSSTGTRDTTTFLRGDNAWVVAATPATLDAAKIEPIPQFERSTTGALALTRATHQGGEVTLSAAGATISFNATTQGAGFSVLVRNRTGSALTVPTFTGATNEYALGATHTQIKSAGNAALTLYTRNSTLYCEIIGDTQ